MFHCTKSKRKKGTIGSMIDVKRQREQEIKLGTSSRKEGTKMQNENIRL